MERYLAGGGTLLLCSHSMYHVQKLCRHALWLKEGRVERYGPAIEVTQAYLAWHEEKSGGAAARRVVQRTASKSAIELVPYDRAYEEGFEDMQRRVPDLSKLHALTGYEPKVQLDEILDRVVAYFTSDASRL